jgi:outer membrane protein OmpA-like peptidoglycan-associated protein
MIAATPPTLVIIPTAAAAPVAPAPPAPAPAPPPPAAPAAAPAATPPTAPSTAPAAAAPPSTPPTQTASLPGKTALPARVVFTGANTDLPDQAKSTLDAVVQALQAEPQLRIELVAYASGSAEQASEARRVSLARAISVRAYLIEKGVDSKRFEVRALGNRTDTAAAAADRVDILALTN